jgi:hypothetical protein
MLKENITGVLVATFLALPLETTWGQQTQQRLTQKQYQQLQELITEETLTAMAQARATTKLHGNLSANPLLSTQDIPNPPPGGGGGSGQVINPPPVTVPSNEQPQYLLEILGEIILGGFIILIGWWFLHSFTRIWDHIFADPPPTPPAPPQTNNPAVYIPPGGRLIWDIEASSPTSPCIGVMGDIRTNGWADPYGGNGAIWTNVLETTIQAREALTAPWTNYLTITLWSSSSGAQELLLRDGSNHAIYTNYSRTLNAVFQTPINAFAGSPAKFFRAALVQQP